MLRKFDVLDEDVARELLAGTERVRTLKTLWERMHNRLFHFYMDQLGTKTRASLYPGDGLDSKSVDGVIRKFDRNYFVSSGYDPSDADEDADHYHK